LTHGSRRVPRPLVLRAAAHYRRVPTRRSSEVASAVRGAPHSTPRARRSPRTTRRYLAVQLRCAVDVLGVLCVLGVGCGCRPPSPPPSAAVRGHVADWCGDTTLRLVSKSRRESTHYPLQRTTVVSPPGGTCPRRRQPYVRRPWRLGGECRFVRRENFALAPNPRLFTAIVSPDGFRVSRQIRRDTTDRPTTLTVRGRRRTRGRTQRDTEIAGQHYVGRACPPTTRDRKVYRTRGLAGPATRHFFTTETQTPCCYKLRVSYPLGARGCPPPAPGGPAYVASYRPTGALYCRRVFLRYPSSPGAQWS